MPPPPPSSSGENLPSPAHRPSHKHTIDRIIAAVVVLGLVLSVIFGIGAFRGARRMHGMRHQAVTTDVGEIRSWMTVAYVARLFALPPREILDRAGLPAGSERKSLDALNHELYPGQEVDVLAQVRDVVAAALAERALRPRIGP